MRTVLSQPRGPSMPSPPPATDYPQPIKSTDSVTRCLCLSLSPSLVPFCPPRYQQPNNRNTNLPRIVRPGVREGLRDRRPSPPAPPFRDLAPGVSGLCRVVLLRCRRLPSPSRRRYPGRRFPGVGVPAPRAPLAPSSQATPRPAVSDGVCREGNRDGVQSGYERGIVGTVAAGSGHAFGGEGGKVESSVLGFGGVAAAAAAATAVGRIPGGADGGLVRRRGGYRVSQADGAVERTAGFALGNGGVEDGEAVLFPPGRRGRETTGGVDAAAGGTGSVSGVAGHGGRAAAFGDRA